MNDRNKKIAFITGTVTGKIDPSRYDKSTLEPKQLDYSILTDDELQEIIRVCKKDEIQLELSNDEKAFVRRVTKKMMHE